MVRRKVKVLRTILKENLFPPGFGPIDSARHPAPNWDRFGSDESPMKRERGARGATPATPRLPPQL